METTNNQNIFFELPGDTTMVGVIDEILKSNGLEESDDEFIDKDEQGEEPRLIIVRDAARVMAEKKIPKEMMVSLLSKHLETSPETAAKIVDEINEKLIPYAKIVSEKPEEETKVENLSKELAEEIQRKQTEPQAQPATPKPTIPKPITPKPPTPPLSAPKENIPAPVKEVSKVKTVVPPEVSKPNPSDSYREPIE